MRPGSKQGWTFFLGLTNNCHRKKSLKTKFVTSMFFFSTAGFRIGKPEYSSQCDQVPENRTEPNNRGAGVHIKGKRRGTGCYYVWSKYIMYSFILNFIARFYLKRLSCVFFIGNGAIERRSRKCKAASNSERWTHPKVRGKDCPKNLTFIYA